MDITPTPARSCAFTGHRKLESDFSAAQLRLAIERMIERGVTVFYDGVAMGFDLAAAEEVLKLRAEYPEIRLVACVPCRGQEKYYSDEDKRRYAAVLSAADEVVILSERYTRSCMFVRNRYMVDRAEYLISYCHSSEGGTAYTVRYFLSKRAPSALIAL